MRKTAKNTSHFNYLALASVLSAIAVIIVHINPFYSFAISPRWIFSNFINTFLTFAVPVFFMISGATLIDYRERYDTKTFLKKRFKRTFIPFVFWSAIATLVHLLYLKDVPANDCNILSIVNSILSFKYIPIFWFFAPLFALYLAIPVLGSIDKKLRKSTFYYIIGGSLIFNFAIPSVIRAFNIPLSIPITFALTAQSAIFYAVVGYYIHNYDISKRNRIVIYALGLLAATVSFVGTTILSFRSGSIVGFLTDIADITYALFGPAVFLFIKQFFTKHFRSDKTIAARTIMFYSNYTFASYLTHWFPIAFCSVVLDAIHNQWFYAPIVFIACIVTAIISKTIFSKIPVLRHLLP